MAMGKPIVSTDVDGLKDVLVPEQNSLVVPPRDAGAFAKAVVRVLDDPQLATRLSQNALTASARFDIQVFVDKMSRLYEQLVERYGQLRYGRPRWDYDREFAFLEDDEQVAGTLPEGGASRETVP